MSLTANVELLTSIPEVVLCGNKIPLKFQASTNFVESAGSKAHIFLTWTAAVAANEYFDLTLKGEVVRFTCKAAPDNSGIQFHDNSGMATLNNWVLLLSEDLKKNYLIARYYDVSVNLNHLYITAKEEGSDYSQEFTAGTGIDCTADESMKTATDKTLRAFYNIVLLLYCRDTFITELVLNVDADGIAETNIADYLKPYLEQQFEWPEKDSAFIFDSPAATAPFYFRYGEKWGNAEYQALTLSDTYYAMFGGVSWMQQAKLNYQNESFWQKLQYNDYFLSWAPLSRIIAPDEPVKLYYLNHSGATSLKLKAKLYTASSDTTIYLDTATDTVKNTIYEMVLSPAKAGYAGLSDETLVKIETWIDNELDVRISQVWTFVLDYKHYEHTRYFMFRNSLGGFECLRTTGLLAISNSYSRDVATVETDPDYTSEDREDISVSNLEQQKFTLAMGWLSRYGNADEYRNWLRDFSGSREVYQVIGSTLKPIRITSDNLDAGKDRETTKGFVFEFVNAFTDEHFTKEITWNLVGSDFSSDFERSQN